MFFFFLLFFCFFFPPRVLLYNPGSPRSCHLPKSALGITGLQACNTMSNSMAFLCSTQAQLLNSNNIHLKGKYGIVFVIETESCYISLDDLKFIVIILLPLCLSAGITDFYHHAIFTTESCTREFSLFIGKISSTKYKGMTCFILRVHIFNFYLVK